MEKQSNPGADTFHHPRHSRDEVKQTFPLIKEMTIFSCLSALDDSTARLLPTRLRRATFLKREALEWRFARVGASAQATFLKNAVIPAKAGIQGVHSGAPRRIP
ncbi:MAG: hypothetical protein LBI87_11430 [Candidatus Accumulibacter sp.]|jgi:hypothetical protein|nr:hypothetical protein [Accumulibacter sp.]